MSDRTDDEQAAGAEPTPGASGIGEVVAGVGARVQEILDMAERIATEIRAEASAAGVRDAEQRRREVDRLVDERLRELESLTETLSARAEGLHREATALVEEMDRGRRRMALLQVEGVTDGRPAKPKAERPPLEPVAYPGTVEPPRPPEQAQPPEQAVLRATQMAVAGTERSEIERMLRDEFGLSNPSAMVDDLLRPKSA